MSYLQPRPLNIWSIRKLWTIWGGAAAVLTATEFWAAYAAQRYADQVPERQAIVGLSIDATEGAGDPAPGEMLRFRIPYVIVRGQGGAGPDQTLKMFLSSAPGACNELSRGFDLHLPDGREVCPDIIPTSNRTAECRYQRTFDYPVYLGVPLRVREEAIYCGTKLAMHYRWAQPYGGVLSFVLDSFGGTLRKPPELRDYKDYHQRRMSHGRDREQVWWPKEGE